MAILQTTYDIVLRGQLDPSLLALVAEYDLGDLPAQVVLQGLPVDPTTLDALLLRAHALGLTVVRVRPVDADPS